MAPTAIPAVAPELNLDIDSVPGITVSGIKTALGSTYLSSKVTFKGFVTFKMSNERVRTSEVSFPKTMKSVSLFTTTAK